MGILDRILLLLCIVTFALLMLSTVLAAFTIVPLEWLDDALALLYGHWEAAAVAAVFFLASVRLLFTGMTSGEPRETMLCQTENGQVRVAISAVRSLVERAARQIKGVKQTKIRLENSRQGMNIYLRIWNEFHDLKFDFISHGMSIQKLDIFIKYQVKIDKYIISRSSGF